MFIDVNVPPLKVYKIEIDFTNIRDNLYIWYKMLQKRNVIWKEYKCTQKKKCYVFTSFLWNNWDKGKLLFITQKAFDMTKVTF